MRINNVVGFSAKTGVGLSQTGRDIAFERKLKENEKKQFSSDLNTGYDILGKQVRAMIIHGPNFPESKSGINTGMGSPYGQTEFEDFAKTFGFTHLQLGPTGARNHGQRSHYLSSIYEKDPALINLELLSGKDYAGILSKEQLKQIVKEGSNEVPDDKNIKKGSNYTRSNFERAEWIAEDALVSAYNNYVERYNEDDGSVYKLHNEFEEFKDDPKNSWLDNYAVLHIIAEDSYDGDEWYLNWDKEDRDLIPLVQKGDKKAIKKYNKILEENAPEVDLYKFKQFIASKQAHIDKHSSYGIEKISDRIASQSSFDILTNKDIFLDDWCIGAKGGGYKGTPQFWGFPLINPNTLFNPDGSLGKGGEYIKKKFQTALDGVDNVRVDHVFAYANPYVYKTSFANNPDNWLHENVNGKEIHYVNTAHLKGNAGFMMDKHFDWDKDSQYVSHLNIPGKENYKRIIPEIILPALREMGFDNEDINKIAWETLGDWNPVFVQDIRPALNLSGMHSMRYMPGDHKECHHNDYALVGTHDDPPIQELVRHPELGANGVLDREHLAQFLKHCSTAPKDNQGNPIPGKLSDQDLVKAKLVELFVSKTDKYALNFTDFFGISEQPNVPGTNDEERPENWTLRLPKEYDANYHKALINYKKEYAINIPEIMRMAIEYKLDKGEIPTGEIHKARNEINKLSKWEEILKEPEK